MKVFVGLGSNIEPRQNIERAKQKLSACFSAVKFSRTFESEAVGFEGDNFFNLVAKMDVNESLLELIERLKSIENLLGRVRQGEKFSSRHIDLDILLYGDLNCQQPIVLPRPEIRQSAYVLWPLSELAPDLIEPGGKLSYGQLWQEFDKTSQTLYPID